MVPRGWLGALRGRRLTIMCCLASFDGSQGCFVSASAISEATGLEANNVRTILRGLERDGWIARDERGERTYFVISYAGPTGQNNPCERVKTTRATGQNNPPYNVWDHTSEQTNGTYSDSAESCASQPTGRDTVPIKVVSKITKGDEEAAPPRPAAPRRPRSERDQLIDRMITWAAAKTFMREDRFVTATRKQWSALIDETAGNESLAQSIILEAYERKDKLLSTQFPVW